MQKLFMKRSELFFSAIQVPVDFLMIVLAAITAFNVREMPDVISYFQLSSLEYHHVYFNDYIRIALIAAPIFVVIFAIEGLYDIRVTRKFWKEALRVLMATSIGLMVVIVAVFLKREWFSSRFIILAAWMLVVFYVVVIRYLLHLIQRWLVVHKGIGVHRLLLIGRNGKLNTIAKLIRQNRDLGYKIVDQIDTAHLKVIKQIREKDGVDEIILCESSITDDEQEKLIDYCAINNITYKYIPTTFQTSRYDIGVLNGEPLIEVKHTPLDGWGRILKRVFDIAASVAGIIITSPIMIVTALAVWIDSDGPIIYKNERVGNDGKKFFVFKFRYMKNRFCTDPNTPEGRKALEIEEALIEKQSVRKGPLYKIKADPRKTRVGRFIEKYSIDELPQFFNVLFGSMSLVGPRPHQHREVEKYMDYHRRLLTIKPGVTGMAQVSGRSDLDFEDEYKLDLYYIENWSLVLDIKICLKTVGVLFRKRRNL
jgi:exopolysaccharide biosynthesis polyprenyl glycosylphosphotransferase